MTDSDSGTVDEWVIEFNTSKIGHECTLGSSGNVLEFAFDIKRTSSQ